MLLPCLIFLFLFHATILEPDFDLTFRETQTAIKLDSTTTCQVLVVMELLLELEGLMPTVRLPASLLATI